MEATRLKPGDTVIYMNHGQVCQTTVIKTKQYEADQNGRRVGKGNCILLDDGDKVRTPNHLQVLMDAVGKFPKQAPVELHCRRKNPVAIKKKEKEEVLLEKIRNTQAVIDKHEEDLAERLNEPYSEERRKKIKNHQTLLAAYRKRMDDLTERLKEARGEE